MSPTYHLLNLNLSPRPTHRCQSHQTAPCVLDTPDNCSRAWKMPLLTGIFFPCINNWLPRMHIKNITQGAQLDGIEGWDGGRVGGRLAEEDACIHIAVSHFVQQKQTQHCKAITLQLIINNKNMTFSSMRTFWYPVILRKIWPFSGCYASTPGITSFCSKTLVRVPVCAHIRRYTYVFSHMKARCST